MNKKEGIIVGTLIIITFMSGAFAAPALQEIMLLNDPVNVRIVRIPLKTVALASDYLFLSNTTVTFSIPQNTFIESDFLTVIGRLNASLNTTVIVQGVIGGNFFSSGGGSLIPNRFDNSTIPIGAIVPFSTTEIRILVSTNTVQTVTLTLMVMGR